MKAPSFDVEGAPSFEKVATCVHCGLCLEACPTYRALRVEMDSPRGRIYLMKGVLQGKLEATPTVMRHLDQCLDCRACETACPSGVDYSHILERTRSLTQPLRKVGPIGRFFRWFGFDFLLPSRAAQGVVFKILWVFQVLGLSRFGAWLGRTKLLPGRLGKIAAQAPTLPLSSFRQANRSALDADRGALVFPAKGEARHRIALFTGCLADQMFAEVNEATVQVLTENGCEVEVLTEEMCCGALHLHNGAVDQARALARKNVEAFGKKKFDAIISNAAGCSAELRHYGGLLEGDEKARAFGEKIRDVSEFLVEIGIATPTAAIGQRKVAYDEPCHLLHAQKISAAPKKLLQAVPGVTLVPLEDADTCCGSAGLYSVLQPDLSQKVGQQKIEAIRRSGADTVATGNPGCLLQIRNGVRNAHLDIEVLHPIQLLARAYNQAD